MPFDVVSEHSQKDVRADSLLEVVIKRPNLEIDAFEGTKRTFNTRELFV